MLDELDSRQPTTTTPRPWTSSGPLMVDRIMKLGLGLGFCSLVIMGRCAEAFGWIEVTAPKDFVGKRKGSFSGIVLERERFLDR